MKTHSRKLLTLLLLISILLTYAGIPSAGAFGTQDPTVQQRQAEAMAVLAEYMTGGGDSASRLLTQHDYSPPVDVSTWRQYPAVRKITTAYLAAQTAEPTHGGERFLALLSQAMARKYDSAKVEPALKPYLDMKFDPYLYRSRLTFTNPSSPPLVSTLPDNVVAAIDTISEYTSKGPVGSPQSILTNHFNLSEKEAFRVLNEHGSTQKALTAVFAPLSDQVRVEKLKQLTAKVSRVYEAVEYEPSLKPYLPTQARDRQLGPVATVRPDIPPPTDSGGIGLPPTGPARGPTTRSPNPQPPASGNNGEGGVGMPSPGAADSSGPRSSTATPRTAAQKYSSYLKKSYASPASRTFSTMSLRLKGFGGVVFGNQITDDNLPNVKALRFEQDAASGNGKIQIIFQDGTTGYLGPVRLEDAYAAAKIVFSGVEDVPALAAGEGVGLVGVEGRGSLVGCVKDPLEVTSGGVFDVVMHPALSDLDLGWSTLMVDVLPLQILIVDEWPMGKGGLLETVEKNSGRDSRILVNELIESMNIPGSLRNWKVVDVPLTVRRDDGVLSLERTVDRQRNYPEGLRRTAFIEMHPLINLKTRIQPTSTSRSIISSDEVLNDYDDEFADRFYRLLPVLTHSSNDYERLNTFASVLALFRWAKSKGASRDLTLNSPKRVATPGAIGVFKGSMEPAADLTSALNNAIDRVQECINHAETLQSVKNYRAKEAQIRLLEERYDKMLDSMEANPPKALAARARQEKQLKAIKAQIAAAEDNNTPSAEVESVDELRVSIEMMKWRLKAVPR